ncbi:hypothetical protein F7C95_09940 [Opitutia bacterium ISCC 51]|nr:hypothetical protein F7C95_09940 [Opitutae bacterium ISCC 51]QXD30236.1 hypothetical protein GA003_09880 [Opitutae bacterium ISCC 52]
MTDKTSWSIGKKLGLAALGAVILLVMVVLPAEYGIDPTGFGRLTSISKLSESAPAAGQDFGQTMEFNIAEYDVTAERIEESIQGLIKLEEVPFRTETIDLKIEDFGEMEHKFIMPADSTLVYSWEVLGAKSDGVYFEFHGHPSTADAPNYPEGFEQAYSKGEGTSQSGSFTTPFPGYHGWYLMNLEEAEITVRLNVSGYWTEHKEMYRAVDGKVIKTVEF